MPRQNLILLVGKTGQIGWELQRTMAPLGNIVALGRDTMDLCDADSIRRRVREAEPALIINAAAYTDVDKAEDEPEIAMAINGTAPGILAEEAKRLNIPLVHYSTDYVFDGRGGQPTPIEASRRPYTETDPPNPINVYGRTKLAGEQAVRAAAAVHLIFRTSWVYATRGRNFLCTIQRLAWERKELRVVDDQIGSPTWARCIAEATGQVLARCWDPQDTGSLADVSGLYHLSASGQTSWHGFATEILEVMRAASEAKVMVQHVTAIPGSAYPSSAQRPAYSVLDNSTTAKSFGIVLPDWHSQLRLCLGT